MIFPIEIWEKILLFADPIDLLRLRNVCKCWKEIIDRILRESDHWKKKCKADISVEVWDAIFEKLFPYDYFSDYEQEDRINSNMWMTIYKLCSKFQQITKSDIAIETLEPLAVHRPSEIITCAKVSSNLLAIGSSEGYIYIFDVTDLGKHILYRADHMEHVCDIQFFRKENNLVAVSASISHSVKYWDLMVKKQIESRPGEMICASYDYCYILIQNILLVQGPVSKMLYQLNLHDLVAITAYKDTVSLYSESGHYATMHIGNEDQESCTMHFIKPPVLNTQRYFLFKNNIILCITECGFLGLSEKGQDWQMYNIFSILYGIPTAALIFNNLLILGLDSGVVYIFKVENFDRMDFERMESKKITLDPEAIVSLDIIILLSEIYLMVTNHKKVYIIKFI